MAFSVVLERLAGQSARVGSIAPALETLSRSLDRCQDAADDTDAAAAHAAAVTAWNRALGADAAAGDDIATALLAAILCYDAADHFPGPTG